MTNIILCGCGGRMGKAIAAALPSDVEIIAGVDINASALSAALPFPVYENIADFPGKADVIVDFSHHSALPSLLAYAKATKTPLVVATTGHTDEELALMRASADEVAVFHSGNFSIGINLLVNLARQAARTLGVDFDIEIVEKHHNKKLDAPSGTALMIANAVADEREKSEYIYDRHSVRKAREQSEIGIHSVRGGTIVGEHEIIFAGSNEVVSISHSAASREIFATGALRAAVYLATKSTGLYSMSDLIEGR
ncbi:MAG: 4-hydroxy-tetrahydrodipicolinate reductase [Clostridia bacterium]|nr:4-hydroxy-tetrahydrodipicolinate reductase [Clostridia bacterium]